VVSFEHMTKIRTTISIDQDVEVEIDFSEHIQEIIEAINTNERMFIKIKKAIDEKTEEYKLINSNYYNLLFI
jgi:hypothetical protein